MPDLLESLNIKPIYNQNSETVLLKAKEFDRLLIFAKLKDVDIENLNADIKQKENNIKILEKKWDKIHKFCLSSYREDIGKLLSQKGNMTKAKKETNKLFSTFNNAKKSMAPYYVVYSNKTMLEQLKYFFKDYPTLTSLLNLYEVQFLTADDIISILKEVLYLDEKQVKSLELIAMDNVFLENNK